MIKYPLVVPTSKERIYVQFLTIMNFLFTERDKEGNQVRSPLTNKELDVLASMMYYNDRYRNLPPKERAEYLMSTDVRKRIRAKLDIKANHLNNVLARLKTKFYMGQPVIDNNTLADTLNVYLDDNTVIEFNLYYTEPKTSNNEEATIQSSDSSNIGTSGKIPLKLRKGPGVDDNSRAMGQPLNLDD